MSDQEKRSCSVLRLLSGGIQKTGSLTDLEVWDMARALIKLLRLRPTSRIYQKL
jgi:hypothetical protein